MLKPQRYGSFNQIQIGVLYTTSYQNSIGETSSPPIANLQEDTQSAWTDYSTDICQSVMRPSLNKPWKLALIVKTGKNGFIKIDNLGTCSLHTSNIDSDCKRTFTLKTSYHTVRYFLLK